VIALPNDLRCRAGNNAISPNPFDIGSIDFPSIELRSSMDYRINRYLDGFAQNACHVTGSPIMMLRLYAVLDFF
jgi:hypothetical protein